MNPEVAAAVLITAAACGLAAFVALMRQAGRHMDDRAELLRGQLDAYRAGQESMREPEPAPEDPWPDPDWWDRQFDGIWEKYGSDGEAA